MKKPLYLFLIAAMVLSLASVSFAATLYVEDPATCVNTHTSYVSLDAFTVLDDGQLVPLSSALSTNAHKVAVETYPNDAGISTRSIDGNTNPVDENQGTLYVYLDLPISLNDTLNLVSKTLNPDFLFNAAGSGGSTRYVVVLADMSYTPTNVTIYVGDGLGAPDCTATITPLVETDFATFYTDLIAGGGNLQDVIVATSQPITTTISNVAFDVVNTANGYTTFSYWQDANLDAVLQATECHAGLPGGILYRVFQVDSYFDTTTPVGYNYQTWNNRVADGPTFYVSSGFGDTCDLNKPLKIAFTTPNEASDVDIYAVFAQLYTSTTYTQAFSAELDTDADFKSFIPYQSTLGVCTGTTRCVDTLQVGDLAQSMNPVLNIKQSGTGVSMCGFITGSSTLAGSTADVTFKSPAAENIGSMWLANSTDLVSCSSVDKKTWTCAGIDVTTGDWYIEVNANGTSQLVPTSWSLSGFTVSYGSTLKRFCANPVSKVGIWSGGLEVLVPFVKYDATNGYQTYIKLFNRYNKPAKVYISTFNETVGDPIMIGLNQIVEIAPGDVATLTADGIQDFLTANVAGYNWDITKGIPVKFQVLVPNQRYANISGSLTYSDLDGDGFVDIPGVGLFGEDGVVANDDLQLEANPWDPYIHGIVVSTYNFGQSQRQIPLLFKETKNGSYVN